MPELNTDADILRLFRAIRGAPATLLLLLLVRGVSMTGREMSLWTGYDNKTITSAKDVLEALGFIQNNGHLNGWSLRSGCQMLLPFMHLLEESYPHPVDKMIGNSPMIGESPINSLTTTTTIDPLDLGSGSNSSSSKLIGNSPINSANDNGSHEPPAPPFDERVATWLRRAGVGEKSQKWRELLAADLDWHTVRAHALERLAQPNEIRVGLFIRRLLDGDPPPAPRCPQCYKPLNEYGQCPGFFCDYVGEDEDEGEEQIYP